MPLNFNKKHKDCISISRIEESNLLLDEYSQNYSRLKTINLMHKAGIKGYYEKADNYYRKVQLESNKRKVYALGKNIYPHISDNIKFIYDDYNQILNCENVKDDHMEYIKNIYGITT